MRGIRKNLGSLIKSRTVTKEKESEQCTHLPKNIFLRQARIDVTPHSLYKFLLFWAGFGATNLTILGGPGLPDSYVLTSSIFNIKNIYIRELRVKLNPIAIPLTHSFFFSCEFGQVHWSKSNFSMTI